MPKRNNQKGIIIDIGTGDGRFVYELAKRYPDRLFIGIDPNHRGLMKTSSKIYKKPARGGLDNALFVLASVEDIPAELEEVANQIFINFPWGTLLRSIVLVEQQAWKNIISVAKKEALKDVVLGYDQIIDRGEIERLELPGLDLDYINTIVQPKLSQLKLELLSAEELSLADLGEYPSSWAKKMRFSPERKYYHMRIRKL